jgi:hypothetical protein
MVPHSRLRLAEQLALRRLDAPRQLKINLFRNSGQMDLAEEK